MPGRLAIRKVLDSLFTSAAGLSVLLMAAALVVILGPILYRGAGAVVFRGTVEFRRMQLAEFGHGSADDVAAEAERARAAQRGVWELYRRFARGIDTSWLEERTKFAYHELSRQLENRSHDGTIPVAEERRLKRAARQIKNALLEAYEAPTAEQARPLLGAVLEAQERPALAGTFGEQLFALAAEYDKLIRTVDPSRRKEYHGELMEVKKVLYELFGPPPDRPPEADLAQFRYGATRWDQAGKLLDRLLWSDKWVSDGPGRPSRLVRTRRQELFAGTELAGLFPMVEGRLGEMLRPRWTFYWRYFTDGSTPGNLFGGVGPELLGTLLLTVLAMALALPVGLVTAAYLVECTREGPFVRFLRMCINTLAGVPSIVFGLFGLAFFVLYASGVGNGPLAALGIPLKLPGNRCILYGSLTLAVLVLPIIIRAGEEAIRAVPRSYKEAALSLGAGQFRTFVSVTLPAALPGVLTGVILSMSRAAGETAPILFTAAVSLGAVPGSVLQPTRALSYSAYVFATADDLAPRAPHNQYGMIMALVLLVGVLNVAAILIRSRVARKLRGQ